MNLKQKSKTSLVLLTIALVILALTGGYFFYARSLLKSSEVKDTDQISETANRANSNTINTANVEPSTTNSQIPADWKSYILTNCGIKIYLPQNWSFNEGTTADNNYSIISNSPKKINSLNASDEGPPSLRINCYNSIKDFINSSNSAKSISNITTSLEGALNIKNPYSDVFYNIFDFASKPQKVTLNKVNGFQGLQGGFGVTLNRYFEHNGIIIEIKTDNFDHKILELETTDGQIQNLIEFQN